MSTTNASMLYPKITQHVSEVVRVLKELRCDPDQSKKEAALDLIPIVGSVKLHGTHADIVIHSDDRIVLQSRNILNITIANDNQGFAAAMADKGAAILNLRDQYVARWKELNPNTRLSPQHPVLIAGEWIGTSIQRDVAISRLSRRFVIVSANINGSWVQDTSYTSIEAPSSSIYNISRGGTFYSILYLNDIPRTLSEVEPLAEAVATSCPFAAFFNIQGEGEGIVWKPVFVPGNAIPSLWFKTKGGRFKTTFAPAPKRLPTDLQEKRDTADVMAAIWCTEERLLQGWDYLSEVKIRRDMKALGTYLKWIQNDVVVEERGYIEEHGTDEGMLRISIARLAKVWFIRRVGMCL